ncbi:CsbD family protein [Lacticaseibacillus baoqingensis]|uniref:CsbD family protein n=1 Tax=Lacticaseibacillus baoqingensis TaxID=2486013 RepID=A0ABW4E7U2_9LACO|nr:CsbD family protein [Lacticaseibacillus baoqingensis]
MADLKASKDKALGKVKEASGKLLNNEKLEAKGKAQHLKGEAEEKVEQGKQKVAKKVNDVTDDH